MLKGCIISADRELGAELKIALAATHHVIIVRELYQYPDNFDLLRILRATAPDVVFLSLESRREALGVAVKIQEQAPGTQVVAFHRRREPDALLETMRVGVREFLAPPFELEEILPSVERVMQLIERNPPSIETTDAVLAFLPAKAGVGCSTIALNTSIALAEQPEMKVLLADFDLSCGMIGFMMQLDATYSVGSALEKSHALDEDLWQKLVTNRGRLDVLPSGPLAPGVGIEPVQIRYLMEFARRNYKAICLDLSGFMEKFCVEILHEAKHIYLVCTPEVPALHLAREKMKFLHTHELQARVRVLVNRSQKRNIVPLAEVEKLLGVPVYQSFPNDYAGVHTAVTAGHSVNRNSELGREFIALAHDICGSPKPAQPTKSRWRDMLVAHKETAPPAASTAADPNLLAS